MNEESSVFGTSYCVVAESIAIARRCLARRDLLTTADDILQRLNVIWQAEKDQNGVRKTWQRGSRDGYLWFMDRYRHYYGYTSRSQRRRYSQATPNDVAAPEVDPLFNVLLQEQLVRILDLLSPAEVKLTLMLVHLERGELDVQEVLEILAVTNGAFRQRKHRLLKRIQEILTY